MLTLTYIKLMNALKNDRRGVTAVEYAVVAGALVTAIAAAFTSLGAELGTFLTATVGKIAN